MNPTLDVKEEKLTGVARPVVAVIGMESVGKSCLLSALTNRFAESSALAGTTLHCERYSDKAWDYLDTPGIVTGSDAVTVTDSIKVLTSSDFVLVVLKAYRAREELSSLLPLLGQKKIAIALTFKDKLSQVQKLEEERLLEVWNKLLGVPVKLMDGRGPNSNELSDLRSAIEEAGNLNQIFNSSQRKSE